MQKIKFLPFMFMALMCVLFGIDGFQNSVDINKQVNAEELEKTEVAKEIDIEDKKIDIENNKLNIEPKKIVDENKLETQDKELNIENKEKISSKLNLEIMENTVEVKEEDEEKNSEFNETEICVIGESSIKVDPDTAKVYVTIENVDVNVAVSKEQTLNMYKIAKEKLEDLGAVEVMSTYFTTYPSYDYKCGKDLIGYYAVLNFCYKLDDLSLIKSSIDDLMNMGIKSINYINYEVSNSKDVYQKVLKQAIDNAKTKAEFISNRTDLSLVKVREENTYYCSTLYKSYNEADLNLVSQVEITAKVKAEFE